MLLHPTQAETGLAWNRELVVRQISRLPPRLAPWTGAPCSPQRTWVEHDLFPMLSPPVYTYLQERKEEGASPGFSVEFGGVGEPHAAFLTESRTRGHVRCSVQNIRVAHLVQPMYAKTRTWGTRPGSKASWEAGKAMDKMTANLGDRAKVVHFCSHSPSPGHLLGMTRFRMALPWGVG